MNFLKNEEIFEFFSDFSKKLEINLLLIYETGSRATGYFLPDSDYDIKGFFIEKNYMCRLKIFTLEEKIKNTIIIKNNIVIDYEFWNIRLFFENLTNQIQSEPVLWFYSPICYLNKINWFIDYIKKNAEIPLFSVIGKLKSLNYKLAKKNEIKAKSIIHIIFFSVLIFWIINFDEKNIILNLERIFDFFEKKNNENKLIYFDILTILKEEYFKMKKVRENGRKALIKKSEIHEEILKFSTFQLEKSKNLIKTGKTQEKTLMEKMYLEVLNSNDFFNI